MQKLVLALALAVAATFSTPALSQTMFGAPDCGEWVKSPNMYRHFWLMGYLTGLNMQHSMDNKQPDNPLIRLSSSDQAILWVDNYCKANPLRSVAVAGWVLFQELKAK